MKRRIVLATLLAVGALSLAVTASQQDVQVVFDELK